MAAEYFSCHSFSKVLVKQHSHDLELSCIFGNVRGNVWMGPLGMLRRSCVFLSAFQRANILLHLRTYSCEILGSWNSLLITPVPLLAEVFFSQTSCNLGTLTHKRCEGWGVASAEMPLGNMILLWVLRIHSSLGEQDLFLTEVTQARECSWKIPGWFEIQAVTLWGFH